MSEEEETEGVLTRWSKRKREVANAASDGETSEETQALQRATEEEKALELEANRLAAEEIDLDTIDEESDLSLFMKEGVPAALKKAALAKLWRSNPVFANVDGLVDYDDNFADPNLIMKTFTSAYQVGRGYLKQVLEEETSAETDLEETEIADADNNTTLEDPVDKNEETPHETAEHAANIETAEEDDPVATEEADTPNVKLVSLRDRLGLSE